MTLFLAICTGIGLALAVGLRPFLPALLACALARGDAGIDFEHTDVAFMEKPAFLLALLIGVIVLVAMERRVRRGRLQRPVRRRRRRHRRWRSARCCSAARSRTTTTRSGSASPPASSARRWPRRPRAASSPARADASTREAAAPLPVYAEVAGARARRPVVLVPPVSLVALAFLLWLLSSSAGAPAQKYAGLRILR